MKKLILLIFVICFFVLKGNSQPLWNNVEIIPDVMNKARVLYQINNTTFAETVDLDSLPVFPGFPKQFTGTTFEGAIFCNLDTDPEMEVVINIGFTVQAFNLDGTPVPGWPKTVSSYPLEGAPAFGDIDGDGQGEIVVTNRGLTSGGFIYAFKKDGTLLPGYPKNHGYSIRTPVLADVDGDGALEIIVNLRSPAGVWIYKGNGTVLSGWPRPLNSVPASSAAVGDIDGDNLPEIIAESYNSLYAWKANGDSIPGFPFTPPTGAVFSYSSPVLVDIDGDSKREIICGTHVLGGGGYLYIIKQDGSVYPNWPKYTNYWIYAPVSVGYIDTDNTLDVVIGDQVGSAIPVDYVYGWSVNGTPLNGFPIGPINAVNCQVVLADIDNDYKTELIFDDNTYVSNVGKYLAYNNDGTPCNGWPLFLNGSSFFTTPCISDLNKDGVLDMVGAGVISTSNITYLYIWNMMSPIHPILIYNPMWQFNTRHNGIYGDIDPIVSINNKSIPFVQSFQLQQNFPNPFNSNTVIKFEIYKKAKTTLRVYDINGKLIQELVNSVLDKGNYSINYNATNYPSGIYFYELTSDGRTSVKKMILIK